jgi:hypothetical protein
MSARFAFISVKQWGEFFKSKGESHIKQALISMNRNVGNVICIRCYAIVSFILHEPQVKLSIFSTKTYP